MKNLQKVIDLDYLITLCGGNNQLVVDMIKLFITEIDIEIQLIEKGITNNDLMLIKSSIHSIRGIVHYVGLNKAIKADLIKIEKLAINHLDILAINMLFSKTKTKFKKAIHELDEWMLLSNAEKNQLII